MTEAAGAEIGKLLTNTAAPSVSQFGSVSMTPLLSVVGGFSTCLCNTGAARTAAGEDGGFSRGLSR